MSLNKDIAEALIRVRAASKLRDGNIIQSVEMSRGDRELLLRTQWLEPIIKGWYMLVKPEMIPGESSYWYANFWKFVAAYLENHHGKIYCLGAENSLDVHSDTPTIPEQVIVIVPKGGGVPVSLPFETSIFPYKDPKNLPENRTEKKGLQVMELGYALCKVTPTYFEKNPQGAEIALRLIQTSDQLLAPILEHGFKNAASRLVGAFQFLGDDRMASQIQSTLEKEGVRLKPENPFLHREPLTNARTRSPYMARITSMWKSYRKIVIDNFPKPLGMSKDKIQCIAAIEETYKRDAYNSLSIEGFDVDEELIERVKNDQWNPNQFIEDQENRNALAARGYYEAFKEVEKTIMKILDGGNAGEVMGDDLSLWYQSLFAPSVKANLLSSTDLLGYRKHAVYIRNSRHIPLSKDALIDAMETFFICLKEEEHPGVRALLGHFIFVYIHPYMDGNGRIGRFLMNTMLISGGYPWTIVQLKNRREYLSSLEKTSVDGDIEAFVKFIAKEMDSYDP
jgi:hypothetical protein